MHSPRSAFPPLLLGAALCAMSAAALAASPATATGAAPTAATYPDRAIRLIVPFPAGGAGDVMARGMAQEMSRDLGQQFVVENRGGAGGSIAAELVAKSPADGYTLLFGTMGTHAINPALYPTLGYDPVADFTPIGMTHQNPRVLVVNSNVPATTIEALIAQAKARPGSITYGSAGSGSSGHLSGALFASQAGVDMLHVPYRGSAQLLTDLLSGRVDATFDSYAVYEEHIKSGAVRALGVTAAERMAVLPHVPTIAEAGLQGYEVSNWLGLFAPARLPDAVRDRLSVSLQRAMATPALREQLTRLGIVPVATSPTAFAAAIQADLPRWAGIVKTSGATAQ